MSRQKSLKLQQMMEGPTNHLHYLHRLHFDLFPRVPSNLSILRLSISPFFQINMSFMITEEQATRTILPKKTWATLGKAFKISIGA